MLHQRMELLHPPHLEMFEFSFKEEKWNKIQNHLKRTWNFQQKVDKVNVKKKNAQKWKTLSVLLFSLSPLVLTYFQQLRKDQSTPNRPMDYNVLWSQY